MSFRAYLDKAEEKTGLTPQQIVDRAHERGVRAPPVPGGDLPGRRWRGQRLNA